MSVRTFWGNRSDPIGGMDHGVWEARRPRWKQVHGVRIVEVLEPGQECGECDGLFTGAPGLPIGVVTADCVPILLERQDGEAVAALHAGWRGGYGNIPRALFEALPEKWAIASEWRVRFGPSIRSCCYEVSPELLQDFRNRFPGVPPGELEPAPRRLDLLAVLRHQFRMLGVSEFMESQDCTLCRILDGTPRYHSYRRGDRNSRQISIIERD
jgi:YfiH family protein